VPDLETVADAAGIERFPLLGLSQGGAIAIAYAARHPEQVSDFVLHGAFARGRLRRNPSPQQREDTEAQIKLAEISWGKDGPAYRLRPGKQAHPAVGYFIPSWLIRKA